MACEFLGEANLFLLIDVVLLDPVPMVAEMALHQVGSSNVSILRRNQKLEARVTVASGRVKKQVTLQGTSLDADHEDHLEIWLGAERDKQLME